MGCMMWEFHPVYYINTWKEAQSKRLYCLLAQLQQMPKRVMPYITETILLDYSFLNLTRLSGSLHN